jgi:predicted adenine nucleotide alpha hydrolase (AANH) superfamily ATPase
LISKLPHNNKIELIEGRYDYNEFKEISKGLELVPEGGERCFKCYDLRTREAAKYAKKNNFDYFTTTLSISPYKNANKLNEIGVSLEKEYDIKYLYADFKKRNGYKRSIELSKEYDLYRQDYCGCVYSKKED